MFAALKNDLTDCSPAKQRKLIRFVSSTCKNSVELFGGEQLSTLAELVEPLIDSSDDYEVIIDAANTFARLDFSPHSLILKFAHKEIAIAAPVLEHSIILNDDDLIDIMKKFDSSYCKYIARRTELTNLVTDTLISNADMNTLISALKNPGATFSAEGFKELATIGSVDKIFGQALFDRSDMPLSLAEPVGINLGIDETLLPTIIQKSILNIPEASPKNAKTQREQSLYLPKAQACIDHLNKNRTTLDECVVELAQSDSYQETCQVLAYVKQQNETKITAIFKKMNGMQFIQLCNGLKLSEDAFEAIAKLRVANTRLSAKQIPIMLQQYKSMASMRT
ncbi:MAG: DUF2336 domain-containing protein [Hyphomicrobiales bacterium]